MSNRSPWLGIVAHTVTVEELQERAVAFVNEAKAIQDMADGEQGRSLTGDEEKRVSELFAAFEATEAEMARRKKLGELEARAAAPQRKIKPSVIAAAEVEVEDEDEENVIPLQERHNQSREQKRRGLITGGEPVASKTMKGTGGYRSFGDFAMSVRSAVVGRVDPRLHVLAAAATTYGQEGVGADGGYLVPPDFRTTILQKVFAEDALLTRTDQQTTSSNSITIPVDETTPWQTSGGILAFWEGEAATYTQSKPALQATTIRANKLGCLVPVTDEQLEDGPSLEAYLRRKAPDKLNYKINDALINGDGVGKPMGLLNSPALVTVAAEGGQTAATVNFANVTKMWSRMYAACRTRAVWVINQDIEPQLMSMIVTGGSPALPAYLPPGGLSDRPYAMLMGRPIVYSEASAAVGTPGDIMLIDFSQYLTVVKAGGIRQDVSMHLWFDQGLTAFRFNIRLGGQCWWSSSIVRAKSALPLSCLVALATR